jgi:alkylation response protein AidB-like acyl-CoA dehydrogenase
VDLSTWHAEARAWLAANKADAPADWGPIMPPDRKADGQAWQRRIWEAGYGGIHWPTELGGQGLTLDHTAAWVECCAEANVPSVLNMVGLVLMAGAVLAYGTDEQQRDHLPPTVKGERVWCQLFSEPGAGSDLASLSTRAEADGEVFVVNGQKVWTSGARCSDWGILLARTDPDAAKHRGISFFVINMTSPGIETRPLRQMTGEAEFDEVFMDDVRVPASNLVGPLHGGWGVAMATLTNERGHIGGSRIGLGRRLDALVEGGLGDDPVLTDRLIDLLVRGRALHALGGRQGPVASVASSLLKLGITELTVDTAMTRAALAGAHAMLDSDEARGVLGAPGARLGGGTSEIQRNIIGELVLGLPREPRPN